MRAWVVQRMRDPVTWADGSQLLKTVFAAVIAWVLAVDVLHLSQAFMAPWAALLTVQATVFGTLRNGLQQAAASVLGVLIAFAAGHLFGLGVLSVGMVVLLGLLVGSVRGIRAQTTTTAATALVVLTNGYSDQAAMLGARLLDTGIGIAVGLLVNLAVWPPLRDRSAAHQIDAIDDRVGDLLSDIAIELRGESDQIQIDRWISRTDKLDDDLDEAGLVLQEARESGRLNPRRAVPRRMQAADRLHEIRSRLAQAIAETRSMARTIGLARVPWPEWDADFREPWLSLVYRSGAPIAQADVGALNLIRAEVTKLGNELAISELQADLWPVYGALLVNLRNVLDALDMVAEQQPVVVPSLLHDRQSVLD